MRRRDFLLLRRNIAAPRDELSCERLYMRYIDAEIDGSRDALFARLVDEFRAAGDICITDTSWLSCEDLRARLDRAICESGARTNLGAQSGT